MSEHESKRTFRVVYKSDAEPRSTQPHPGPSRNVYTGEKVELPEMTRKILLAQREREWRQMYDRYREFLEFTAMIERDLVDHHAPNARPAP